MDQGLERRIARLEEATAYLLSVQGMSLEELVVPIPDAPEPGEVTDQALDLASEGLELGPAGLELSDWVRREVLTPAQRLEKKIDGWGLRYFKGSEFTPYWSRVQKGVKNSVPPENLWNSIARTLVVLDRLRGELGTAINMTSTYRNPDYNRVIGGEPNSYHMVFKAIDFVSSGRPSTWAAKLKSYRGDTFTDPATGERFVFRGGIGTYSTFVHVDTKGTDSDW